MRFELPLQTLELGIWQNICSSIGRRENTWSFHQVLKAWTARRWWSVDLANSWVSGIFSNIGDSWNPLRNDWFYLADRFLNFFWALNFFRNKGTWINKREKDIRTGIDTWYSPRAAISGLITPICTVFGPPSRPVEDQRVPLRCKSLHCNHCLSTAVHTSVPWGSISEELIVVEELMPKVSFKETSLDASLLQVLMIVFCWGVLD